MAPDTETRAGRPLTWAFGPVPVTVAMSSPFVALTMTLSGWASSPPPITARSATTLVTSVPDRSLTTTLSAPPRVLATIDSTSLRSIVIAATSRVNRTRPPLAETSMFSLALLPLNAIVSMPAWPSTTSLPSPGSHWNAVVAGSEQGDVVALLAVDEVVAVAAEQEVDAVAAEERVVARAAVDGDGDQRGQVPGRGEAVVAAVGVEDEVLGRADVDRERRRVEAIEADAGAVGRGGELLGAVAAVDLDRVGAPTALVEVGVVAGVPDHPVVAALPEHLVVGVAAGEGVVLVAAEQEVEATLAEERVVAGLAEELVAAGAAGEHVVADAAEQVGGRQRAVDLAERDHVLPALTEDAGSARCWRPSAYRR